MAYSARLVREPRAKNHTVEVLRDGVVIGTYARNYPTLFDTFCPFVKDGREYALYSTNHTVTRVMELPSCRDLGGEEPDTFGFCPVDYFVPVDPSTGAALDFGFVAGCVWGDDSSWKVQALDLRAVASGVIGREERFGYVELPEGTRLPDAVRVRRCDPGAECEGFYVELTVIARFEVATGKRLQSYDV